MTWVEATLVVLAVVAAGLLVDRARHPARYPTLQDVSWLKRSLAWVGGVATVATAAAVLAGSGEVAQLVAGIGLLAFFFLLYMLARATWRPR